MDLNLNIGNPTTISTFVVSSNQDGTYNNTSIAGFNDSITNYVAQLNQDAGSPQLPSQNDQSDVGATHSTQSSITLSVSNTYQTSSTVNASNSQIAVVAVKNDDGSTATPSMVILSTSDPNSADENGNLTTTITVISTPFENATAIADLISQIPTTATQGSDGQVSNAVVTRTDDVEGSSITIQLGGNQDTAPTTITIKVSDLQQFTSDDLTQEVINAGGDDRRQLYLSLQTAFQYLGVTALPSGISFVTSVLLASRGFRPDASANVNAANTYDGGASVASATTYIGQVIPPDLTAVLQVLGASTDFINGYNDTRSNIIQSMKDEFGDPSTCNDVSDETPDPTSDPIIPQSPPQPRRSNSQFDIQDFYTYKFAAEAFNASSLASEKALSDENKERVTRAPEDSLNNK